MTLYLTGDIADQIQEGMWRYKLTPRERRIAFHYIHGCSQKEIADKLGCSPNTVKNHLAEIKRKCGFDPIAGDHSANPVRLLRMFAGLPPIVYRRAA